MAYGWLNRTGGSKHGWLGGAGGGGGASLPQQGSIIFQHDMYDGDTSPQTGSVTFSRSGAAYYPDSASTLGAVLANNMAIDAYQWGQGVSGMGVLISGRTRNEIAYSTDFTNAAWVNIGTGTATQTGNTVTDPTGSTAADTLSHSGGGADTGIEYDLGVTAASKEARFSVFLKASTGTPVVKIRITDSTNSEIGETWCELSSTEWRRFECYKKFTASATVNLHAEIIHGTETIYAWGAQGTDVSSATARRDRRQGAETFVGTSGSKVTSNSDSYSIPNSIYTQMATKGSLAMWYNGKQGIKGADGAGGSTYLFSAGSEQFAAICANSRIKFWINSGARVDAGEQYNYINDSWMHYVFTWDTVADSYKIYINGVDRSENEVATTAITPGANTLFIGNRSGLQPQSAGDGIVSQVVIWDVVLSASEAEEAYDTKKAIFEEAAPSTGKIFEVDFASTIVPSTYSGTPQMWYTRAAAAGYHSGERTWAEENDGVPTVGAYAIGHPVGQGLVGTGGMTNVCLQSEDFNTTWTLVGGGGVTSNVFTSPDGTATSADLVSGASAGDGVEQSITGATAASNDYIFSVYIQRAAGTFVPDIRIEDSTNSEGTTVACTPTVSNGVWDRYFVYHEFSAGATGDINVKVMVNDTSSGSCSVWGAMCQERDESTPASTASPPTITAVSPSMYIPTVASSVACDFSSISYAHNNAHFNGVKGTAMVWASNPHIAADVTDAPYGHTLYSVRGHSAVSADEGLYLHWLHNAAGGGIKLSYWYNGNQVAAVDLSSLVTTRHTWHHYAITWDTDADEYRTYVDGALQNTDTTASIEPLLTSNMWTSGDGGIAGNATSSNTDNVDGLVGKIEVHGSALDTATILSTYNAEKTDYSPDYGWPSGGSSESNVTLQFLMDETGTITAITDEVAAFQLDWDEVGASVPTRTGDQSGTNYGGGTAPGIHIDYSAASGSTGAFANYSASAHEPGTSDYTMEWVAKYDASGDQPTSFQYPWSFREDATGYGTYLYYSNAATNPVANVRIRSSAGATDVTFNLEFNPFGDGLFHKHRLVMDRDGNATYYIDGEIQESAKSISARNGQDIPGDAFVIWATQNGTAPANGLSGTMLEFRYSKNATNNSGGPGGG